MQVQLIRGALTWESGCAVDADGSPRAYAMPGSGLHGLDDIAAAGHHGHWWGVVCNASGVPLEQGEGDPCPGFCVSTTALVDRSRRERDPLRYVHAETVPYIAVPPELVARGVRMGDVGVAIHRGVVVGGIVADEGPSGKYGEGSIALAAALGIPSSPRGGGVGWGVTWVVFPSSRATPRWPRAVSDFQAQALGMFEGWGGMAGVPWLAPNV